MLTVTNGTPELLSFLLQPAIKIKTVSNMKQIDFIIHVKLVNSDLNKLNHLMKALKHFLAVILILFSISAFSQETKQVKNRRKVLEKQEKEKEKAQEDSIKEGKERHLNIQSKKVKKRIKKNAKRDKKRLKQQAKRKR